MPISTTSCTHCIIPLITVGIPQHGASTLHHDQRPTVIGGMMQWMHEVALIGI